MRSRLVAAVVVVVGISVGAPAALVAGGEAGPSPRADGPPASPGVRVTAEAGISVRRPETWHVVTAQLTRVLWPVQRLAVTSFALHQPRPDPNCAPATAMRRLPAAGALLYMFEYTRLPRHPVPHFPPRAAHFRIDAKSYLPYECMGPSYRITFGQPGRDFQVHMLVGRQARPSTRARLMAVLDSLTVAPLESRPRLTPRIGVPLSGRPLQVTSGLGSVWVLTCRRNCSGRGRHSVGELLRVRTGTAQIAQRITVQAPTALAIGGGAIWLTHFNAGSVSRLDLRSGRVTGTVSDRFGSRVVSPRVALVRAAILGLMWPVAETGSRPAILVLARWPGSPRRHGRPRVADPARGVVDIAVTAFAKAHHNLSRAGLLLAGPGRAVRGAHRRRVRRAIAATVALSIQPSLMPSP